jgi:hypothetical protein
MMGLMIGLIKLPEVKFKETKPELNQRFSSKPRTNNIIVSNPTT